MRTSIKPFLMTLAAVMLFVPSVHAQTPGQTQAAPLSQGRAAVLLASRLGFALQTNRTLSEVEAVRIMMENNITPFGGWQLDEPLFENDLARLLVQAMGREGEIPEEERENPQTTAYQDFLLREYDLVVAGVEIPDELLDQERAGDRDASTSNPVSTDPLVSDPVDSDPSRVTPNILGSNFLPVTEAGLLTSVAGLTPSPGAGPAGRPSQQVQDTTPSTP